MAPKSQMFIFSETKTVCWFPPKVLPCCRRSHLRVSHLKSSLWRELSHMILYDDFTCILSLLYNRQPKEPLKTYFLFGVLCGLALYNRNVVHLPFPLVLFKKLLRVKPSLDDMREFWPSLAEEDHPPLARATKLVLEFSWLQRESASTMKQQLVVTVKMILHCFISSQTLCLQLTAHKTGGEGSRCSGKHGSHLHQCKL